MYFSNLNFIIVQVKLACESEQAKSLDHTIDCFVSVAIQMMVKGPDLVNAIITAPTISIPFSRSRERAESALCSRQPGLPCVCGFKASVLSGLLRSYRV